MTRLTVLLMAATLALHAFLLFTVASYAVSGRDLAGLDILVSGVSFFCVVGAAIVLIGLLRGRQYVALAATVAVVGLAIPGAFAALVALSGGLPFVY